MQLFCIATVTSTYAVGVEPSPKKINILEFCSETSYTVTAFAIYIAPDGTEVDVRCTKTAGDCTQASVDADRCRDLNVCSEARGRGLEPASSLNCPTTAIFQLKFFTTKIYWYSAFHYFAI